MNNKPWFCAILMGALAACLPSNADQPVDSLNRATEWLNSSPLTAADLRGKVVLVDFWTYTCINWLRTMPHVRAWTEKYRANGLVVIGVHTPEFEFEKEADNVQQAVGAFEVAYPVVMDNDNEVWRAFRNQAWPAIYLIDAQGRTRFRHFGEGNYEATERAIQALLAEAGHDVPRDLVVVEGSGIEAAADWTTLKSPEAYLGYERSTGFSSRQGPVFSLHRAYETPQRLGLNRWALAGNWTVRAQSVSLNRPAGRIAYRFHARDLNLVMGPEKKDTVVHFRVRIDGQPPGASHGSDVDEMGNGVIDAQRAYQLIRQPYPIVERLFEIEFLDAQVEAFSFTFG